MKEAYMTERRSGWTIAVLAILGLVATACQVGPAAPPPGAQADAEAEFITNMGTEPDTIDPQVSSFVHEIGVIMKVYDALMTFDPNTSLPIPNAAKEAPKLSSDGLTYTFTLKDGLKYSDGTALTAKNFEYGFKRLCDPEVAGDYAFTGYVVVGCEAYSTADATQTSPADLQKLRDAVGVRAIDDKTIEYKLKEKAPYFLSIMATWVGLPTREDLVKKGGETWAQSPENYIGNGVWVLKEWKHNEKMVFERNENHTPKANFKTWTQVIINEHAVEFAAYRNNELDVVAVAGPDLKVIEADADLSKQLNKNTGTCTFYQGYNTTKPPFDDPNVRLAFSKAVDREQYVKDILGGIGVSNASFMPPGFPNYDPDDTNQKFDAAAAKQLLAQSKYAADLQSGALKVSMGFSSSALNKTRAEWFQGQYKQNLGIDIALDPQDSTTYTRNVKEVATTPQMFRLGWCADYPDEQDWLTTVFHSSSSISHTGWKNDQYDTLVRQADAEPDQAKRSAMYKEAQRILTKDSPAGFVYTNADWYLVKPWIQSYKISPLDYYFSSLTIFKMFITPKPR
jgi:oligopeptide transport system substrate-binding protein